MEIKQQSLTNDLKEYLKEKFTHYSNEKIAYSKEYESVAFLALENDKMVGAIVCLRHLGALHLSSLFVEDSYQHQGLEAQLIQHAMDYGLLNKCSFAIVETTSFELLDFYQKLGFILEFTRTGYENESSLHYLRKDLTIQSVKVSERSFPHFLDKHRFQSLITPEKHIDYYKLTGRYPTFSPPQTFIFCYSDRLLQNILNTHPHQQCDGSFSKVYFLTAYPGVAIGNFGIGAPINAMKLELLISWGVKQFISLGLAGGLQRDLSIGDIIICEKAIRDEGTSHHYLAYDKYAYPSKNIEDRLSRALDKMNKPYQKGISWTTDTFFRQTREEVEHYQKEGVLCVEMEAAALFCVASLYNVEIAAIFTISDTHANLEWTASFEEEKTKLGLQTIVDVALIVAKESNEIKIL